VEARKDPADVLFRRAVVAYKGHEYGRAERLFLASWDLAERPATMCNLALTYEQWGARQELAIQAYERCAASDDTGRYRRTALARAERLKAVLAAAAEKREAEAKAQAEAQAQAEAEAAAAAAAPAPLPGKRPADGELIPPGPVPEAGATPTGTSPTPSPRTTSSSLVLTAPTPAPGVPDEDAETRWWLWSGVGGGVLAVAVAGVGVFYVQRSNDASAELEERYPDLRIPAGSPDAEKLERARADGVTGKRLYLAAGVVTVASAACVVVDLVHRRSESRTRAPSLGLSPARGGATLSATLRF